MAPSLQSLPEDQKPQLKCLKITKIRKPIIEKMRRDRINSCIGQLKLLLEKDIQLQHPHSKLEKADILEMAVNYLQQQRQQQICSTKFLQDDGKESYYQGYYMCLKEMVGFLHNHEHNNISQATMLKNFCRDQAFTKNVSQQRFSNQGQKCEMWRPW
ncbi:transcription factor HES-5-like [Bombina bombina]|uniref:transcription factor HES-5-like n=1 Tax=Bombina bombina TaxID=8345 RepID=UPI00235AE309|nr:transcription factor HES-5-like [Bombina bombina]